MELNFLKVSSRDYELQNKKRSSQNNSISSAKFIGLDKITAKTSEIIVNLGETTKFGPLEIKVLKCGKIAKNTVISSKY